MITIAFFNSKDAVGRTSLVYHLAWMFSELGVSVVVADLDPQAYLTTMLLRGDRLEEMWSGDQHPLTIQSAIEPILEGKVDIKQPHTERISDHLHLIPGDLGLANFEDTLSQAWQRVEAGDTVAFRAVTAFQRAALLACQETGAEVVLLNLGPNVGAVNRAALIASENVVVPLSSDFSALIGLRSMGPQLRSWRDSWDKTRMKSRDPLPSGAMKVAGYVLLDRPVRADWRWTERIPREYRQFVLNAQVDCSNDVGVDPECLAVLRNYRSLIPLALEAHKPIFFLKPADGAIGAHGEAVRDCYRVFTNLANRIADKCAVPIPRKSAVSF